MDSIIDKEGNKNIKSIYYNKAQLLYRLKEYDAALDTLYKANDEFYDTSKAALLILLGREAEARIVLNEQIKKNEVILYQFTGDKDRRDMLILGTVSLYILSDMHITPFLSQLVKDNIITQKHLDDVLINQVEAKETILSNMWPKDFL
jgi:tetratricopeptide (TPR) repeat protein